MTALRLLCTSATLASCGFYLVSMLAAVRFFRRTTTHQPGEMQPVSILIPLCGADAGAYENMRRFAARTTRRIKSSLVCVILRTRRCRLCAD